VNLQGMRFGRLRAVCRDPEPNRHAKWLCACDCGNMSSVPQSSLIGKRKTSSCGCWRNEKNAVRHFKHRQRFSLAYRSWANMKQRTTNPNNPDWHYYGGAGVKLCERWYDFEAFFADMGEPAPGLTIDRIDPYGNYEPSNCKWATRKEQRNNQREARL